jgi:YkoY family integral membrane protein
VFLDFHSTDLLTIGLLVVLEGLLSADNALVLAILVLGVPREQQRKALRYGMLGAFGFRALAVALADMLMRAAWVKLLGGLYLAWLAWQHFSGRDGDGPQAVRPATPMLGLSAFWATVVRVELIDLAFSVDSILVAVALSPKLWVVVTGGILGIITMRMVAGQMIELIRRYPTLVDAAWVAFKLVIEYGHDLGWIGWQVPQVLSLGLIVVIFGGAYVYARLRGGRPAEGDDDRGAGDEAS